MKIWNSLKNAARKSANYVKSKTKELAALITGGVVAAHQTAAHAQVTLPDTGVDLEGSITAMGTSLGTVLQAAVLLGLSIMVIAIGYRFIRRFIK